MSLFLRTALFSARSGKLDGVSFPFPSLRVRPPLSAPTQHSVCSLMRTKKTGEVEAATAAAAPLHDFPLITKTKRERRRNRVFQPLCEGQTSFSHHAPDSDGIGGQLLTRLEQQGSIAAAGKLFLVPRKTELEKECNSGIGRLLISLFWRGGCGGCRVGVDSGLGPSPKARK